MAIACACSNGAAGSQICRSDGSYGPRTCDGAPLDEALATSAPSELAGIDLAGVPATGDKRLFVTSQLYVGDLEAAASATGGLASADKLCQSAADGAVLGGTWRAPSGPARSPPPSAT